jgi:transposase
MTDSLLALADWLYAAGCTHLVDERTAAVNRLQHVLEDATITVAGVTTDVMGVSGRAILEGRTDPETLAELARGKLRAKREALAWALSGRVSAHHRLLVTTHLAHAEFLVAEVGTDRGRFPTAGHLTSWAAMCPGSHASAGRRQGGKTCKGSTWLRRTLVEAAHGAVEQLRQLGFEVTLTLKQPAA